MFDFLKGSASNSTKPSLDVDEVQQIFSNFEFNDDAEGSNFIALRSGDGFTTQVAVQQRLQTLLKNEQSISITAAAQKLDIEDKAISDISRRTPDIILSSNGQSLISIQSLEEIALLLRDEADRAFVSTLDFVARFSLPEGEIQSLMKIANDPRRCYRKERKLVFAITSQYETAGFITSERLKAQHIHSLAEAVTRSAEEFRAAEFHVEDFPRLDSKSLQAFIEETFGPSHEYESVYRSRIFTSTQIDAVTQSDGPANTTHLSSPSTQAEEIVWFMPTAVVKAVLDNEFSPLISGSRSCLDLRTWQQRKELLPGLFSSIGDAVESMNAENPAPGLPLMPTFIRDNVVISGYFMFSRKFLASKAEEIMTKNGKAGFLQLHFSLDDIPLDARPLARPLVTSSLIARMQEGEQADEAVVQCDAYLILKSWLHHLLPRFITQTEAYAMALWTGQPGNSNLSDVLSNSQSESQITSGVAKSLVDNPDIVIGQTDLALLELLWRRNIGLISTASAKRYSEAMKTHSTQAFVSTWRERLSMKIGVHSNALTDLQEGLLKQQLSELLNDYVIRELIPSVFRRAEEKARGIQDEQRSKAYDKLVFRIKESKSIETTMQYITKFESRLSMKPRSDEELASRKVADMKSLRRAVEVDTDAPRRFLCAVTFLFASQSNGILHATGKFAPKLLKLLHGKIGDADYKIMEVFKEEAKNGAASDDTVRRVLVILDHGGKESDVA